MNIGVFDSGLGGLWILKHLKRELPDYNYIFFGDQSHIPYGTKTIAELFTYTTEALEYLYGKKDCSCVILACNTTSSAIYPQLEQWVGLQYPGKKLFGIVHATVNSIPKDDPVAIFATVRTVESHVYINELQANNTIVTEVALVELSLRIEYADETKKYITSFAAEIPETARTGVLCCTHYGIVRQDFIDAFPHITLWISQEEIIPEFFKEYIAEHKEFAETLSTDGVLEICVTKESTVFNKWLKEWFGDDIHSEIVSLNQQARPVG